ncbi:hypothetical protein A4G23_05328 [Streptomyces rubrolavendulae]|uniref:Uncharacterized protein n=1 Tax=Streptomyces rubrolavendulae TaxID=285473 RepID=A0A1D8GAF3_9ACTN|nr:hypothetical protein A4G23_05328 [Streptomyces rubrolavendulae]
MRGPRGRRCARPGRAGGPPPGVRGRAPCGGGTRRGPARRARPAGRPAGCDGGPRGGRARPDGPRDATAARAEGAPGRTARGMRRRPARPGAGGPPTSADSGTVRGLPRVCRRACGSLRTRSGRRARGDRGARRAAGGVGGAAGGVGGAPSGAPADGRPRDLRGPSSGCPRPGTRCASARRRGSAPGLARRPAHGAGPRHGGALTAAGWAHGTGARAVAGVGARASRPRPASRGGRETPVGRVRGLLRVRLRLLPYWARAAAGRVEETHPLGGPQ